jgi:hypothetical protein
MHLLQLGVLHLLEVGILSLVVEVHLALELQVVKLLLLSSLRVDAHKLRERTHGTDYTLAPRHLLVVNLHLHHFVSILAAVRPRGNASNVLGDHLVELLPLLLLDVVHLADLGHFVCHRQIGARRI